MVTQQPVITWLRHMHSLVVETRRWRSESTVGRAKTANGSEYLFLSLIYSFFISGCKDTPSPTCSFVSKASRKVSVRAWFLLCSVGSARACDPGSALYRITTTKTQPTPLARQLAVASEKAAQERSWKNWERRKVPTPTDRHYCYSHKVVLEVYSHDRYHGFLMYLLQMKSITLRDCTV